jgi:hypothetical protein
MEKYYGNYLGLVVNDQDPEGRDRVQIYVPGVTNTIYDNWNNNNTNKSIGMDIGSTFTLNEEILKKLRSVLPWAEKATPLIGPGTAMYHQEGRGASSAPIERSPNSNNGGNVKIDGTNGKLDINNKDQLVPIDGFANHYANPIVAKKFEELIVAAKAQGINLGITDSYRTYSEQVDLKRRKPNLAATPGTSKHGIGLAFDLTGTNGTSKEVAYQWLAKNAPAMGWANFVGGYEPDTRGKGNTQLEPWHWQINEKDLPKYSNLLLGKTSDVTSSSTTQKNVSQSSNEIDFGALSDIPPTSANIKPPANQTIRDDTDGETKITELSEGTVSLYSDIPSNVGPSEGMPQGTRSTTKILSRVWLFFYGGDVQNPVFFAYSLPPNETRAHNNIPENNSQPSNGVINPIVDVNPEDLPKSDDQLQALEFLNMALLKNEASPEIISSYEQDKNDPFLFTYNNKKYRVSENGIVEENNI